MTGKGLAVSMKPGGQSGVRIDMHKKPTCPVPFTSPLSWRKHCVQKYWVMLVPHQCQPPLSTD